MRADVAYKLMDNWNEIRTAAQVARSGTISAAAEVLGVHRATVNRHIDELEATLGAKLFQRHARGYTPTELGLELLRVANATNDQFSQLRLAAAAKEHSLELSGELVITSLDIFVDTLIPVLNAFRAKYTQVHTRFISSGTLLKLEYGEAHVAFRAGPKPNELDNVVQLFKRVDMALYASTEYVATHGLPSGPAEYDQHAFVAGSASAMQRVPYLAWIQANVPHDNIRFSSDEMPVLHRAVLLGSGIGFLPIELAQARDDLVEVLPTQAGWSAPIWRVTHVDLHRTPKVQAFLEVLKEFVG